MVSHEPLGTPLTGRKRLGCNCYSAATTYLECIMPEAHEDMLSFFRLVEELPGYEEMEVIIEDEMDLMEVSDHETTDV